MNVFSPLHDYDDDEPMDIEPTGVPRSITLRSHSHTHQPSKLDHVIDPADIEVEKSLLTEELEKSPSRRRASGRLSDPSIVAPLFVQPGEENVGPSGHVIFKQPPPVVQQQQSLPVAPITMNSNQNIDPQRITPLTPMQLGKVRPIDIPSSLEKFKSLKIGLDSLHQSGQPSAMASPAKNPFTPKVISTGLSDHPPSTSNEYLKSLIEESLCEFKSSLRNDIQNLHVELIKQSLTQQSAFAGMMEDYMPAVKELMEEIRRLREENKLLRLRLQL